MAIIKVKFDRAIEGATNIVDSGTEGTRVATGTTAQRGSTAGQLRFNTTTGLAEYYNGTEFKSIDTPPTVTAVSPEEVASLSDGNATFSITGSNFQSGATVKFIGNDNTSITASSVTVNSSTSITAVAPNSSFSNTKEPYDIQITNTNNLVANLNDCIYIDNTVAWSTASGSIASIYTTSTGTHVTVSATDPDGDTVSYSETGGTVLSTAGLTLNSSTGAISGTPTSGAGTLNFTLRATANSKTADRNFSITVTAATATSFLVVAGGGGGGRRLGGGGGAGGYRSSYNSESSGGGASAEGILALLNGTTYTITVGAGGAGNTGTGPNNGYSGSDSSISGSGLTTITSSGGGGGGNGDVSGVSGGSGGGGGYSGTNPVGGSGTANQGYAGGNGGQSNTSGGGGGASEAGTAASSSAAGPGGDGVASTITGSSVTRAGGGGGAARSPVQGYGDGGAGGGGYGGSGSAGFDPSSGSANYGGGGGGGRDDLSGASGGSGVVILRMPTASFTNTTTGSPSVSQSGSDTIIVFNSSGSYTA
jgi:hypothetical protein